MPNPVRPEVERGQKFVILAISGTRGGMGCPASLVDLGDGRVVTRALPEGALEHWTDWLGSFHVSELTDTKLFLWAARESERPTLMDQEIDELQEKVWRLLIGLLLATPGFSTGRITFLAGGHGNDGLEVRRSTTFRPIFHTLGSRATPLTVGRLRKAADLGDALARHPDGPPMHRITRAIRSFREGLEHESVDDRLHQFVRACDGFVGAWNFTDFSRRIAQLCTPNRWNRHTLGSIYRIRGQIEHLHGPVDPTMKRRRGGKVGVLLRRAIQAEITARFLLISYLGRPELWKHFKKRETVEAFWANPDRLTLWPERLVFPHSPDILETDSVRRALDAQA